MATEIYPMPMFPTLSVRDAAASARWYEALGFEHVFAMPDAAGRPQLVHLRWTKYTDVLLREVSSPVLEGVRPAPQRCARYATVGAGTSAHTAAATCSASSTSLPTAMPR